MNNNTLPLVAYEQAQLLKKENITPGQLVKRWLPNFERRFKLWKEQEHKRQTTSLIFVLENFSEALVAFENHIRQETWREACEMMRDKCASAIQGSLCNECYYQVTNDIENTPIPEMPKNNEK